LLPQVLKHYPCSNHHFREMQAMRWVGGMGSLLNHFLRSKILERVIFFRNLYEPQVAI
jgi:hypothetical protein